MRSLRIAVLPLLVSISLLTLSCFIVPDESVIKGEVTSIAEGDGGEGTVIVIDKGSAAGIKLNQEGRVLEKGDTIATISVDELKEDTCRAIVLEHTPFKGVAEGLAVRFDKNGTILSTKTPDGEKSCVTDTPGPYIPTAGGNMARTGSYDDKGVPSPVGVLWKFQAQSGIATFFPPVSHGMIFLGDGGFYAVDTVSREEVYRFARSASVYESPTVLGGTIFVSNEKEFFAADVISGAEKWRLEIKANAPAVSKDRVFLTSFDGKRPFVALDAATGKEIWSVETGYNTWSIPSLDGDIVYFVSGDNYLYAVDIETGDVRWKNDVGPYSISRYAVIGSDAIYVANKDYLIALDKENRTEKWRFKINVSFQTTPAVARGAVYVFGQESLHSLDAQTGLERWRLDLKEIGVRETGVAYDPPIVVGGVVYFGGLDESVYAVDADTGELLWSYETEYKTSTPVVVDGVLYVTSGPYLYAIK